MHRVSAAIFLVAFFSALPLYGLSSQRGWVTVTGKRSEGGAFLLEIVRRDAFSTRTEQLDVQRAHVQFIEGSPRRAGQVVLTLETSSGPRELVREEAGTVAAMPEVMRSLQQHADVINSPAAECHFELGPEPTFWVMSGLVLLFAAAGLVIAFTAGRSPNRPPPSR
jgi:hypothetical protein